MKSIAEEAQSYWDSLYEYQSDLNSDWQLCEKLVLNRSGTAGSFFNDSMIIPDNDSGVSAFQVLDSTAKEACLTFSNGCASGLIPVGNQWASFTLPDEDEVETKILSKVSATVMDDLSTAGFQTITNNFFADLGVMGIGGTYTHKGSEGKVVVEHVLPGSFVYMTDSSGFPSVIVRKIQFAISQIVKTFGYENCPKQVREKWDQGAKSRFERLTIFHFVYDNEDFDKSALKAGLSPAGKRRFKGHFCSCEGSTEPWVYKTEYYYEFPYQISPTALRRNSIYGESPSMMALPDITSLNRMVSSLNVAAELRSNRRWRAHSEYPFEINNTPGSIIWHDSEMNKPEAVEEQDELQSTYKLIEDARARIKSFFFTRVFQLFSDPEESKKWKTATEAMLMNDEKMMLLAPIVTTVMQYWLTPICYQAFAIRYRSGYFNSITIPGVSQDRIKQTLEKIAPRIEYVSEFSRSIRKSYAKNFQIVIDAVMLAMQIDPNAAYILDVPKLVREYVNNLGLFTDSVRSEEVYQSILAEVQAQMAARQQAIMNKDNAPMVSALNSSKRQ